jgi:hypothetical protein
MIRASVGGLAAAVLLIAASALPGTAEAHAIVIDSSPAVDGVTASDFDISIRFNSRIDQKRSRLTVLGADNVAKPVPLTSESRPDLLAGHVTGLPPGEYRIRWQVLAVDGHITRGDIPFRVAP